MTLPIPEPVQFRNPETVPKYRVCPHCKRRVVRYAFYTGEFINETYSCPEHGAITPIWSAVFNQYQGVI